MKNVAKLGTSKTLASLVAALVVSISGVASVSAAETETTPVANAENKDFVAGQAAVKAKKWNEAVDAFKKVVAREPNNADAQNYLAYSYRWTNKLDDAFKHYNLALKLDPNHKGAHEYIGVAYLKVDQPEKAKEHLAKLEKICTKKCEEYEDLARAIAAYKPSATPTPRSRY
jgi:tetratricopeptide (TPR) repeat protein